MEGLELTKRSLEIFLEFAEDAKNWSGTPWVNDGNIWLDKEDRGNLADLIKKGLIVIRDAEAGGPDEGSKKNSIMAFTKTGVCLAGLHGIAWDADWTVFSDGCEWL